MKIFDILLLMGLTSLAVACSGNIEKDGTINVATPYAASESIMFRRYTK